MFSQDESSQLVAKHIGDIMYENPKERSSADAHGHTAGAIIFLKAV